MKKILIKNLGELFIGRKLSASVKKLVEVLPNGKVTKEDFLEVLVQIFYRFTRIGLIALLLSIIPVYLLYQQNKILRNQNKLIETQVTQINNQNQLIESQRRSSLMFVYGNILEQINTDLSKNIKTRKLSNQTIGNIISLSKGLKPYRFLEDSLITSKALSPERGQLLNTLLNSDISFESLEDIFRKADFTYSDLRAFDLQYAKCIGCNLANSEIHNSDVSFANFTGANLTNVCFKHSKMANTNFEHANISNANFDEVIFFDSTNFNMAIISHPNWFENIKQTGFYKLSSYNSVAANHVIDTIGFTEFDERGISRFGYRVYNQLSKFGANEKEIKQRETLTKDEIIQLRRNIMNNPNLRAAISIDSSAKNEN